MSTGLNTPASLAQGGREAGRGRGGGGAVAAPIAGPAARPRAPGAARLLLLEHAHELVADALQRLVLGPRRRPRRLRSLQPVRQRRPVQLRLLQPRPQQDRGLLQGRRARVTWVRMIGKGSAAQRRQGQANTGGGPGQENSCPWMSLRHGGSVVSVLVVML